jgi:hypothetical protein
MALMARMAAAGAGMAGMVRIRSMRIIYARPRVAGTGEGGESDRPSTYRIYSENFEHENATKLRGKVPVIPKSDEEAPSEA